MPYVINGSPVELPEAENIEGTTYVPCADVTRALGGLVEWKHDAKTARVEIGGKVGWIQPENANAVIDGLGVDMKGAPMLKDDTLWVPARLFRDGFGLSLSVSGTSVTLSS